MWCVVCFYVRTSSSTSPKTPPFLNPNTGLVIKPDFAPSTAPAPPKDARRLLLTALGSSLARDGDLRVFCLSGAVLDARLLAHPSPLAPSDAPLAPLSSATGAAATTGASDEEWEDGSGSSNPPIIHPRLPFLARKAPGGRGVVRTAFFPHLAPPLYLPIAAFTPHPAPAAPPQGLPVPLPPIRLPEGRAVDHVLWVAAAAGEEGAGEGEGRLGAPCLLVVDAGRGLYLYQVGCFEGAVGSI